MNEQETKLIDGLFAHLAEAAQKSGPRDPAAEQRVNDHLRQQPAAPYYMAQTILVQRAALKKAQERLQASGGAHAHPPAAAPQPSQQPAQQSGGGGFLAGAAQTALGVAGGVIVADFAIGAVDELAYGDVYDDMALGEAYDAGASDVAAASDLGGGDDLGGEDFGDFGGGDDFGGGFDDF